MSNQLSDLPLAALERMLRDTEREFGPDTKTAPILRRAIASRVRLGPPRQDHVDLWVCGQFRAATPDGIVWDFQGIFSSRERAVKACRNEKYFIAPLTLDGSCPHGISVWPGLFYPLSTSHYPRPEASAE